jgi:hypothetical protein
MYRRGILTFISYPTKEKTYVVAFRELGLLVEEKDREFAKLKLLAQAKIYLESVNKEKLGEDLLNKSLPKEIEDEFAEFRKKTINSRRKSESSSFEQFELEIGKVINGNKLNSCFV